MADDTCETVRIKDDKAPGGYVVINKEDFDEKIHSLYEESMSLRPGRKVKTSHDN